MRPLKALVGLLLLPLCASLTLTVGWTLHRATWETTGGGAPGTVALLGGFLLWTVLFCVLPKPVRAYVLGHELTHALWSILLGGWAGRLRVGREGGSVEVTTHHFLVTLAPYFFPFYTFLVVMAYGVAHLWIDPAPYQVPWLGLVGLSWGFHLTFTLTALLHRQDDVRQEGRLFSYALILLLNLLGVMLALVLTTPGLSLEQLAARATGDAQRTAVRLLDAGRRVADRFP